MTEWYRNLAQRERLAVSLGALFVVLSMVYTFIYEPLENTLEVSKTGLAKKQSELTQLKQIANEYNGLGAAKSIDLASDNQSLLAVIDSSGAAVGIKSSIKRLTPEGVNKVRVRVEDVAFDQLVEWLVANSTKHAIHAELLLVRQAEKDGMVNATLLFTRG